MQIVLIRWRDTVSNAETKPLEMAKELKTVLTWNIGAVINESKTEITLACMGYPPHNDIPHFIEHTVTIPKISIEGGIKVLGEFES